MNSNIISDAERATLEKMRPALKGLAELAVAAIELATKSLNTAAASQGQSKTQGYSLQVTALLVTRVMNDLRAALHLAHLGYPVQAAGVVASLMELAQTVAYIGVDDARANVWLKHRQPGTTPWRLRTTIIPAIADRFGIKRSTLEENYGLMCMLKHGNPMAEMQRVIRERDGRMRFPDGPDSSDHGESIAWAALLHGVSHVLFAQRAFVTDHVQGPEKTHLLEMSRTLREAVGAKRAEAKKRWPWDNPFGGPRGKGDG